MLYVYHMLIAEATGSTSPEAPDLWRALANPVRRQLLDVLGLGPRTTGDLAAATPELSRFAVMQHLGVLTDAGLVVVRRRGRHRFNHLNPVPLRSWYERWVTPFADRTAADLLALQRTVEAPGGGSAMATATAADEYRTVRVETELRFRCTRKRLFDAITKDTRRWFPATYGEEKVIDVIVEPRVGGAQYEDWGDGRGHLYGHVTVWDPPIAYSTRGRLMPGTILDSSYELEADGDETVLRVSKVAVGPITDDEAASIQKYGDIARFAEALRAVVGG
jgi:DNA-binding transcriptional ArsR family regulator